MPDYTYSKTSIGNRAEIIGKGIFIYEIFIHCKDLNKCIGLMSTAEAAKRPEIVSLAGKD